MFPLKGHHHPSTHTEVPELFAEKERSFEFEFVYFVIYQSLILDYMFRLNIM